MIVIDKKKCVKCGNCIEDCIVKLLQKDADGFPFLPESLKQYCLNCQHCLAVCPAAAVTCNGVSPEECAVVGKLPSNDEMLNLLRCRRSVRRYKNENIDPEIMAELKKALNFTATGCNDRRLVFYIAEDREKMSFFREKTTKMLRFLIKSGILKLLYPKAKRFLQDILKGEDVIFRNAPHMIVCAVHKNAPCKEADPFIALSNFDLMAQSCGLGTCWCGFAVYAFKFNRSMRQMLNMPKGYKIASVMLFGRPDVKYYRGVNPPPFKIFN